MGSCISTVKIARHTKQENFLYISSPVEDD